jgi:hypothetical protein
MSVAVSKLEPVWTAERSVFATRREQARALHGAFPAGTELTDLVGSLLGALSEDPSAVWRALRALRSVLKEYDSGESMANMSVLTAEHIAALVSHGDTAPLAHALSAVAPLNMEAALELAVHALGDIRGSTVSDEWNEFELPLPLETLESLLRCALAEQKARPEKRKRKSPCAEAEAEPEAVV